MIREDKSNQDQDTDSHELAEQQHNIDSKPKSIEQSTRDIGFVEMTRLTRKAVTRGNLLSKNACAGGRARERESEQELAGPSLPHNIATSSRSPWFAFCLGASPFN
jgi:hypothetical protein